MPNYGYAKPQPYDSRILSQDADTFTTYDPEKQANVTVAKNQGVTDKLKEGFTVSGKGGAKIQQIREGMGWKTFGDD